MIGNTDMRSSRRSLLRGGAALATTALLPHRTPGADAAADLHLNAGPARIPLRDSPAPETEVWAYDGSVPGPAIRRETRNLLTSCRPAPKKWRNW